MSRPSPQGSRERAGADPIGAVGGEDGPATGLADSQLRRVASGGWRRALTATALGAAAGLAVAGWLSRAER